MVLIIVLVSVLIFNDCGAGSSLLRLRVLVLVLWKEQALITEGAARSTARFTVNCSLHWPLDKVQVECRFRRQSGSCPPLLNYTSKLPAGGRPLPLAFAPSPVSHSHTSRI